MILTDADKLNPLWLRLEQHYQQRLEELRVKNDAPLSEADTIALRARIAETKAFLALGKDQPIFE